MRNLLPLFLLSILFVACGGEAAIDVSQEPDINQETDQTETPTDTAPEVQGITLTPMPATQDYPDAAIVSMSYAEGEFKFGVDNGSSGYELGQQTPDAAALMCANSGKGQHIHLIVDDSPYAAKYEADFTHEIADGVHYLLAFLSRSYHESLKHAEAATFGKAVIEGNSITSLGEVKQPMLFYSRPKGNYVGDDANQVMLDFYPINVELGADYKVKVEVADASFVVDEWQPYFLKGLPMGEHKVTLTLIDGDGEKVNAPLNPVSRTITLAP